MSLDIDHLRGWVGRERRVADALSAFPAQALAAALNRSELPRTGDALPPAWQWMYFLETPMAAATGTDGHPRLGGFLPPIPLPRRMWAAGEFEMLQPLRLGIPAERHSVITAVELKQGKSGAMVFVTLRHTLYQGDQACIEEVQNIVYRDMPTAFTVLPAGEPAPLDADLSEDVRVDPVLLFRYSALTYNGHRIHYDRDYAMQQEFYPALVVHAPLQATLMMELLAAHHAGRRLKHFRFRAVRPSFDTQMLTVAAKQQDAHCELWAAQDGQIGMRATAILE